MLDLLTHKALENDSEASFGPADRCTYCITHLLLKFKSLLTCYPHSRHAAYRKRQTGDSRPERRLAEGAALRAGSGRGGASASMPDVSRSRDSGPVTLRGTNDLDLGVSRWSKLQMLVQAVQTFSVSRCMSERKHPSRIAHLMFQNYSI